MIEGTTKREQKKDVCHSTIVLKVVSKVVSIRRSKVTSGQKKKRQSKGEVY
jgi:hypothetical protein